MMASVRTAVSIHKSLFDQVEDLAHEMQISRSRLFVLAVEEFIERHRMERYQNQKLLEEINAAYKDAPDSAEQDLQQHMRRRHRELVKGEW